ncbi:hypothetical protein BaRGS_00033552 [Batillaria attramentaria]|uniref:Uncharacterized protein n=1 Tax=Batillaria attramentaria TaxID=370345 RepID=A0ABD0JJP4_9CAEN
MTSLRIEIRTPKSFEIHNNKKCQAVRPQTRSCVPVSGLQGKQGRVSQFQDYKATSSVISVGLCSEYHSWKREFG